MKLTFELAVNGLSFGQTSTLILRTIFDRIKAGADYDVNLFPIGGGFDLSTQKEDKEFEQWINSFEFLWTWFPYSNWTKCCKKQ